MYRSYKEYYIYILKIIEHFLNGINVTKKKTHSGK